MMSIHDAAAVPTRGRRVALLAGLALVLLHGVPAVAAVRAPGGAAAAGDLEVETIEFGHLADPSRGDRRVPIKLHIPTSGGPHPVVVVSHGAGGHSH